MGEDGILVSLVVGVVRFVRCVIVIAGDGGRGATVDGIGVVSERLLRGGGDLQGFQDGERGLEGPATALDTGELT